MKRKECFEAVTKVILSAREEANKLSIEIQKQREIIDNPKKYAPQYIAEARAAMYALNRQLEDIPYQYRQQIRGITDQMRATLQEELQLHGEDIHEDAKLLDYDLTAQQFVDLLNRHSENMTMTQLILKAARKQNVELGVRFTGNDFELEQLNGLEFAASTAMKHATNEGVFDQLFGPESPASQIWNVDDRERPKHDIVKFSDDRVANAARMLSDSRDLSDSVQADIVREFADQPGIVAVLKDAAHRGRKVEAEAVCDELLGDQQSADFTRRAANVAMRMGPVITEEVTT